ncbi:gamma-glutamylcyclotransferase [Bacillaceae bacterium W0354]
MKVNIFVYGTLLKNERNHSFLEGATCIAREAWTSGSLYDTGKGYPAMTRHHTDRVYGEVYEVTLEMLSKIDHLEGYFGKGKNNHYERIEQVVFTDFGPVEAFVYIYDVSGTNDLEKITYGDWKCHKYLNENELLYFAYGSCMDNGRFCLAGVDEQFSQMIGCGVLQNYSMVYTLKSHDGGRADMIESNEWVEGKVYKITKKTLDYLFDREGVHTNVYRPTFIDVTINGMEYKNVLTFLVIEKEKQEVAPPAHYATEILRGAKGCVSDAYYEKLEKDLAEKFGMVGIY